MIFYSLLKAASAHLCHYKTTTTTTTTTIITTTTTTTTTTIYRVVKAKPVGLRS